MSFISSSKKSTISCRSNNSRRSVRFQLNYNLKSVLTDFEHKQEHQGYRELICGIRPEASEIRDDDLLQILTEARSCINVLGKVHHLFVQVLLMVKWAHRSAEIAEAYQGFVLELCSAHNYFTKSAIEQLIANMKLVPAASASASDEAKLCEDEEVCFQRVHTLLKALLHIIPMSVDLAASRLVDNFPYVLSKNSKELPTYIGNMLRVLDYRPEFRLQFLSAIVSKLLEVDVNAPRSELMEPAEDAETFSLDDFTEAGNPVADSLDLSLDVMFRYFQSQCFVNGTLDFQRTKALYSDMITVFERVILTTHESSHVQFLMFYLLSLKSNLVLWFLQNLWRKVTDPNLFHVIRQAAISYIASLLSRAKYIPMSAVKDMLTQLSGWIHTYIANCDGQVSRDPRTHAVFYSACQALFYLIAFRHKDIVLNSPKGLAFLQGLHLSKIVTCQLNPLRVCLPAVTQNFASVARHYQLAYCYSVIEHNQRNSIPVVYRDATGAILTTAQVHLDTFFPFDPYLLKRTYKYISEFYRQYDSSMPDENHHRKEELREDEDDFLMEQSPANSSLFTYGTSPGFLQT